LGLKPRMPSRTNVALIRLMIRLCSPTRLSRSRLGRLPSSYRLLPTLRAALAAHATEHVATKEIEPKTDAA